MSTTTLFAAVLVSILVLPFVALGHVIYVTLAPTCVLAGDPFGLVIPTATPG